MDTIYSILFEDKKGLLVIQRDVIKKVGVECAGYLAILVNESQYLVQSDDGYFPLFNYGVKNEYGMSAWVQRQRVRALIANGYIITRKGNQGVLMYKILKDK